MANAKFYNRLFWILVLIDLAFLASHHENYRLITKPLLMPLLILSYNESIQSKGLFSLLIIAALAMSTLGDVALQFESRFGIMAFIIGLVCFLIAHVLYILYFMKIQSEKPSYLQTKPYLILPVLAFSIGLLWFLWNDLDELKVPVILYALILSTMLISAINTAKRFSSDADRYFITGAILFVFSDSLLAINKFHFAENQSSIISISVMFTYCFAQFSLVKGSIHHLKVKKQELKKKKINSTADQ